MIDAQKLRAAGLSADLIKLLIQITTTITQGEARLKAIVSNVKTSNQLGQQIDEAMAALSELTPAITGAADSAAIQAVAAVQTALTALRAAAETAASQAAASAAPLASAVATFNTLQNADALISRGAELVLLMPWSGPMTGDLDANGARFFEGLRLWLEAHHDRPVWIIPAGPFVTACRAAGYTDDDIYTDGLHLRPLFARGVSYLTYSFLTQQRCPFVRSGDEAVDQIAWDILTNWECAGMGGTITIPVPSYTDPLPNSLPPP